MSETPTHELPQLPFDRPEPLALAPAFRALQASAPIARVRTPAGDEAWLATSYELVKALFADPRLGRSHPDPARAPRISGSALLGGPSGDYEHEQAQHQHMRRLLTPAFSARRMQALRTHIDQLVDGLLDQLVAQDPPADMHEALSVPLPVLVICELLGVPYADRDQFRAWSSQAGTLHDPAASRDALGALHGYMRELADAKRSDPGQDVMSDLVAAQRHDPQLCDDYVAGLGAALLFAGHETTVTRIDTGTVQLLIHPGQYTALAANPDLVDQAVEEILRMPTPGGGGGGLPRYAHDEIPLCGVTIHRGEAVLLASAAANHDPTAFPDPEVFDITRKPTSAHLAFGHGPRFCIGASLARVELRAVFTALPARLPNLRLAVPPDQLRSRPDLLTGGLTELPVTW